MGGIPVAGLNLTQAQQDLIRDIAERGRQSGSQIQQKVREAQEAQRRASETFPVSENAVRTAALALAEAQADLAVHQARVQNEIFNALTAEQQAEVRKRQAERDARQGARQERQPQRRGVRQ
jgi:Spy/CpxP family protein refolding chaperone